MTPGYWVVRVDVADMEAYRSYVAAATPVFAHYGAKFLVRAGRYECLEGSSRARNFVIEFPSYQAALDCWHDAVYQLARKLRLAVSTVDLIVVEGCVAP
jgi:uncharacterized protein (DUF1330 family)